MSRLSDAIAAGIEASRALHRALRAATQEELNAPRAGAARQKWIDDFFRQEKRRRADIARGMCPGCWHLYICTCSDAERAAAVAQVTT